MESAKKYKVVLAQSGKMDIIQKKKYMIQNFKYRQYAENYSQNIKNAAKTLNIVPTGYEKIGFQYRGYDIYIKPQNGHLLFYVVDETTLTVTVLRILQNNMDWQFIIKKWLQESS